MQAGRLCMWGGRGNATCPSSVWLTWRTMLLLWPGSLSPLGSGSLLAETGLHVPGPFPRFHQHLCPGPRRAPPDTSLRKRSCGCQQDRRWHETSPNTREGAVHWWAESRRPFSCSEKKTAFLRGNRRHDGFCGHQEQLPAQRLEVSVGPRQLLPAASRPRDKAGGCSLHGCSSSMNGGRVLAAHLQRLQRLHAALQLKPQQDVQLKPETSKGKRNALWSQKHETEMAL